MKNFLNCNLELIFWSSALLYLAFIDPTVPRIFSLCPVHNLGFDFCQGCGLGRSVSFLLHGDIGNSLKFHSLGIPAAILIIHRILSLLIHNLKFHMRHHHSLHS